MILGSISKHFFETKMYFLNFQKSNRQYIKFVLLSINLKFQEHEGVSFLKSWTWTLTHLQPNLYFGKSLENRLLNHFFLLHG